MGVNTQPLAGPANQNMKNTAERSAEAGYTGPPSEETRLPVLCTLALCQKSHAHKVRAIGAIRRLASAGKLGAPPTAPPKFEPCFDKKCKRSTHYHYVHLHIPAQEDRPSYRVPDAEGKYGNNDTPGNRDVATPEVNGDRSCFESVEEEEPFYARDFFGATAPPLLPNPQPTPETPAQRNVIIHTPPPLRFDKFVEAGDLGITSPKPLPPGTLNMRKVRIFMNAPRKRGFLLWSCAKLLNKCTVVRKTTIGEDGVPDILPRRQVARRFLCWHFKERTLKPKGVHESRYQHVRDVYIFTALASWLAESMFHYKALNQGEIAQSFWENMRFKVKQFPHFDALLTCSPQAVEDTLLYVAYVRRTRTAVSAYSIGGVVGMSEN